VNGPRRYRTVPNWPQSEEGTQRTTYTDGRRQLWRQVGWHGQTGAFYAYDENPKAYEPGGWSPLWLVVEDDEWPL
jgi:hypothetical protein